jgi:ERCC4-related helicase
MESVSAIRGGERVIIHRQEADDTLVLMPTLAGKTVIARIHRLKIRCAKKGVEYCSLFDSA